MHPDHEASRTFDDVYVMGDRLLIAPITELGDRDSTNTSRDDGLIRSYQSGGFSEFLSEWQTQSQTPSLNYLQNMALFLPTLKSAD